MTIRKAGRMAFGAVLFIGIVQITMAQKELRAGDVDDRGGIVTVRSTNQPVDGTVIYFDKSGKKARTIDYVKGKKEGYVRMFSGKGEELVRERWREGIQHGLVEEFFPSGRLHKERHFVIGRITGPYSVYDESGQLRIAGSYVEGKKTGMWRVFSGDGELVEMATFRGGVLMSEIVDSDSVQKPNKAPEPTTTSVTSPAAQEPRQP